MHEGKQQVGHINKLNPKTASLITQDHKHWSVVYNLLFKVLDGEQDHQKNANSIIHGELLIAHKAGED